MVKTITTRNIAGISKPSRLSVLLFCFLIFSMPISAEQGGLLEVNLNSLKFGIDKQTGCIVSISNPDTGEFLKASGDTAGLVDLAYPIKAFTPMRLATRFSSISRFSANLSVCRSVYRPTNHEVAGSLKGLDRDRNCWQAR